MAIFLCTKINPRHKKMNLKMVKKLRPIFWQNALKENEKHKKANKY